MRKNHTPSTPAILFTAIATLATTAHARPVAISEMIPTAQALANVDVWIKAHPKDAAPIASWAVSIPSAWAWGNKIPLLSAGTPNALPTFAEASSVLTSRDGTAEAIFIFYDSKWVPQTPSNLPVTAEDIQHLTAAIAAYRKAIALNPNDALSELALAWMLTQQGQYARELPVDFWPDLKPTDVEKTTCTRAIAQLADADPKARDAASDTLSSAMPKCIPLLRGIKSDDPETKSRVDAILLGYCELQALAHYRKAFDLKKSEDLNTDPTYDANTQISAKAATQILALLSHNPAAATPNEQKILNETLLLLQKKLDHLNSMPQ